MDSEPDEPPVCLDILLDLAIEVFRPIYVLCSFVVAPTLRFVLSIPSQLKKKAKKAYNSNSPSVERKCRLEGTSVDGENCVPCNKKQGTENPFKKLTAVTSSRSQPNNVCPKEQYIQIPEFLRDIKRLNNRKCDDPNCFDPYCSHDHSFTARCRNKQSIHNCPKIETFVSEFAPRNCWVHQKEIQQKPKTGVERDEGISCSVSSFSNPNLSSLEMGKTVAGSVDYQERERQMRVTYQNYPGSEREKKVQISNKDDKSGGSKAGKGPPPKKYVKGYSYDDKGPPPRKYDRKYSYDDKGPAPGKYDRGYSYDDKGPPPRNFDRKYSYYDKGSRKRSFDYTPDYSYDDKGPPPKKYLDYTPYYRYDHGGPPPKRYVSDAPAYGYRDRRYDYPSYYNYGPPPRKGPKTNTSSTPPYRRDGSIPRTEDTDDDSYSFFHNGKAGSSRLPRRIVSNSSIQTRTTWQSKNCGADHNIESLPTTTISLSTMSTTASPSTMDTRDTKLRPIKHTTPLKSQDLDEEDEEF